MIIGRRPIAGLGTSLVLALALGWSAVGAKTPKKTVDWVKVNPAFEGATFVNDPESYNCWWPGCPSTACRMPPPCCWRRSWAARWSWGWS